MHWVREGSWSNSEVGKIQVRKSRSKLEIILGCQKFHLKLEITTLLRKIKMEIRPRIGKVLLPGDMNWPCTVCEEDLIKYSMCMRNGLWSTYEASYIFGFFHIQWFSIIVTKFHQSFFKQLESGSKFISHAYHWYDINYLIRSSLHTVLGQFIYPISKTFPILGLISNFIFRSKVAISNFKWNFWHPRIISNLERLFLTWIFPTFLLLQLPSPTQWKTF